MSTDAVTIALFREYRSRRDRVEREARELQEKRDSVKLLEKSQAIDERAIAELVEHAKTIGLDLKAHYEERTV